MEGRAQTSPPGCRPINTPLDVCPCQDLPTGQPDTVKAEMQSRMYFII